MRLIALAAAALIGAVFSLSALAAPPYDVRVDYTPSANADGQRLYVGACTGTPADAAVTPGKVLPRLITAAGTYQFCLQDYRASTGETRDQTVSVTIDDILPLDPSSNFTITIRCTTLPGTTLPSCTSNVAVEPTP